MPIIDVRSHVVAEGKYAEAVDWLKKVIHHLNSQNIKARVLSPINGDMDEIFAVAEFESLAAMEEFGGAFFKSDKWTKDLSKGLPGLFTSSVRYQHRIVE
jgi:hypothetical protein